MAQALAETLERPPLPIFKILCGIGPKAELLMVHPPGTDFAGVVCRVYPYDVAAARHTDPHRIFLSPHAAGKLAPARRPPAFL